MSFHPNLDPELASLLGALEAPFEEFSSLSYADLPTAREPWLVEPEVKPDFAARSRMVCSSFASIAPSEPLENR